jgi:hypothetical protein
MNNLNLVTRIGLGVLGITSAFISLQQIQFIDCKNKKKELIGRELLSISSSLFFVAGFFGMCSCNLNTINFAKHTGIIASGIYIYVLTTLSK